MGECARLNALLKSCAANQRVIVGAIEMYNLDHSAPLDTLDRAALADLVKGKYLRSLLPCPAGGAYSGRGLAKAASSSEDLNQFISCSLHGNIENIAKISEEQAAVARTRNVIILGTVFLSLVIMAFFFFYKPPSRKPMDE